VSILRASHITRAAAVVVAVLYVIATGVSLVFVLLAGLTIFGSIRATDHLFRVIGGIMLILVVIPAVLA
jgi:small neutral amino acid transporter SnatA (MarC family)